MAEKKESKFLMYKGIPLVRCGDTIYYGNMGDPYIIMIQINTKRKLYDRDVADKVTIQLLNTDPNVRLRDKIVKKIDKYGLYEAMDIATAWLDRATAS